jgi:hypothetical protein
MIRMLHTSSIYSAIFAFILPLCVSSSSAIAQGRPPLNANVGGVERDELAPVMSADGSGLPYELWRGLDVTSLETLISELEIPPRSPALHGLWKRLITSQVAPQNGASADTKFTALRLEALYRSGLAQEAASELSKLSAADDPNVSALAARNALASGNSNQACEITKKAAGLKSQMPKQLKAQAILMAGYCAVLAKDTAGAGLAAEIAREEGLEQSLALDALDAISIGTKIKPVPTQKISLIDYRLSESAGGLPHKSVLDHGEPALLVALANDPATPANLGMPASEAAARLNALSAETLAAIYRANAKSETADALLAASASSQPDRRVGLFKAAESEQTPQKKTRLIRAFLDDAKRHGMTLTAMQMIAPTTAQINPQPELSWFAETACEIGLASGQTDVTRRWVALDPSLAHWLALADIADDAKSGRDADLTALENLAVRGRFLSDALHRLATVLDALNYNVPIPLWDAASRTPQPSGGYLPPTGVLSSLQDAAKKKEFGRTVLLVMKTIGPNEADGAHMIALGDSIRALKRAGLESEARRLGVEALIETWPRMVTN